MRIWKRIGIFLLLGILIGQPLFNIHAENEYGLKKILENPEYDSDTEFGCSVAINDNYIYIGAEDTKIGELINVGKVYKFNRNGDYIESLQATEPIQQDKFGWEISADYDKLLISEYECSWTNILRGQSYLYNHEGTLIKVMDCPEPDKRASFGQSLAILPDNIIVGAPYGRADDLIYAGRLHVYNETGNLIDTINSPNPKVNGGYGFRIVADEDLIVVTEMLTNDVAEDHKLINGIVYVYNSDWELLHTINSPTTERNSFGYKLALNDNYIFIGDKFSTAGGVERAGKVFLYSREGEFVDSIEPTNPVSGSYFGESMAVSDDKIVIGEPWNDETTVDAGKAYVYQTDGTWITELVSPEPSMRGYFGGSVAIHGDDVIVGEPGADKAYIFSKGAISIVETDTEEETSTEETTSTEEKKDNAIPGYPIHTILIGIASITLIQLYRKARDNSIPHFFVK